MDPRHVPCGWAAALVAVALIAPAANAVTLRSPQVPFFTPPLQTLLDALDPGIDVAAAQVDGQVASVLWPEAVQYTLTLDRVPDGEAVGIYDTNDPGPTPALYLVVPGVPSLSTTGWTAQVQFTATHLTVLLFDQYGIPQGQTSYPGDHRQHFGFYFQNAQGTEYSQDGRNAGGLPQVLTYASPGDPAVFWECVENAPSTAASRFDSAVLRVVGQFATTTRSNTWGRLKTLYR